MEASPSAERHLAFLPPGAGFGECREGLADRLAVARRPDLRLVARRAGTGLARERPAATRVTQLHTLVRPTPRGRTVRRRGGRHTDITSSGCGPEASRRRLAAR